METTQHAGTPPRRPGRHPALIGAFEAARILLAATGAALLLATVGWFIGLAAQRSPTAIIMWAATGLSSAAGWSIAPDGDAVGGADAYSLVPTALSLILWLLILSSARRTSRALAANARLVGAGHLHEVRWSPLWAAAGIIGVCAAVLLGIAFGSGAAVLEPVSAVRFAALLVTPVAVGLARGSAEELLERVRRLVPDDWAEAMRAGGGLLLRWAVLLSCLTAVGLALAVVLRWEHGMDVLGTYSDPRAAAVGLSVVQTVYAPTALLFTASWMSGAGIELASGIISSPFAAVDVPLPGIPVLAVIPLDAPGWAAALPVFVVLCGSAAVLGRRSWQTARWRAIAVAGVGAMCCALLLGMFAHGGVGPGGLADFGVPPVRFALIVAAELTAGALLGWGAVALSERGQAPRADSGTGEPEHRGAASSDADLHHERQRAEDQ